MEKDADCRFAEVLADRMSESAEEVVARWLERIEARVKLERERIFPTDELLDHVPVLVRRIASHMENPSAEISADGAVAAKAMELGELRHAQGFQAAEILKEYEILGGILFTFVKQVARERRDLCDTDEILDVAHRLFRAVSVVEQVTTGQYLRLADERIRDREDRLRGFNRMVSHELKNRIGAVLGAGELLAEEGIVGEPETRTRFARMVVDNAQAMRGVLDNLLDLSRLDASERRQRRLELPEAVREVVRQLRGMAEEAGVEVRVAPGVPEVEVDAGAVELCLSNYLSNAIKYADPERPDRRVEIRGRTREGAAGREVVVEVDDNGIGVSPGARERLFDRFFRADDVSVSEVEGTGMGLSIVRETVEGMGGAAWAELEGREAGSLFAFSLPARRTADGRERGAAEEAPEPDASS